jgi:type I restriction enzyme S subunit
VEVAQAIFQHSFDASSGERIGRLSDLCQYGTEKITVNELSIETYISTENMLPNKGGVVSAASLPAMKQTTRFDVGSVLVSNIRPYFKKIVLTDFVGGCSTDVSCLEPTIPNASELLFCITSADDFFDYMMAGAKGTKMPRGDKKQILNYPIVIPTDEDLAKFSVMIRPLFAEKTYLSKEIKRLAALRDILLPKLMSGELSVAYLDTAK